MLSPCAIYARILICKTKFLDKNTQAIPVRSCSVEKQLRGIFVVSSWHIFFKMGFETFHLAYAIFVRANEIISLWH